MIPQSNSSHSSHGSSTSSSSSRTSVGNARMSAGETHTVRSPRPASSIPVSDTAISQADGAA